MRPVNTLAATVFGVALLASGLARAEPAPLERIVSYADLDLSRTTDLDTLYSRLTLAAEKVCRPESLGVSLRQRRIGERCMAHAMSKAVDQIGSVDLTARFLVEYRYYVHERELQVARNPSEKKLSVPVGTALPASSLGQIPNN